MKELDVQLAQKIKNDVSGFAETNLLEAPEKENWLRKHALEPFVKSAIVEPASVFTQFLPEAYQPNIKETPKPSASSGRLAETLSDITFSMAGAAIVYGGMAVLTKGASASLAEKGFLNRTLATALTNTTGSMVTGAAIYDFARKPHEGETRLGNAASGAAAFAIFGGGHHLTADKGVAIKLAAMPLIGAVGGLVQKQTNVGISQNRLLSGAEVEQAAVQGALLNTLMPLASSGVSKLFAQHQGNRSVADFQKTSPEPLLKDKAKEVQRSAEQDVLRRALPINPQNRQWAMDELGRGRSVPLVPLKPNSTVSETGVVEIAHPPNSKPTNEAAADLGRHYKIEPTEIVTTERRYVQINASIKTMRDRLANTFNDVLEPGNTKALEITLDSLKLFSENTKIPERMRIRTMLEIEALIRHRNVKTELSQVDRAFIGADVLKNIFMPDVCIRQIGGTCVVASYEVRLASLYPQKYANLIRQVATTGSYRGTDGSITRVPANSISNADTYGEGNHANRLFQVTAPNIAWQNSTQRPDGSSVPAGSVVFEMPGTRTYLMDYSDSKRGVPLLNSRNEIIDSPYMHREHQATIDDKIVGRGEIFQITHSKGNDSRGAFTYTSLENLKQFLSDVGQGKRRDTRFPLLIDVDADRIQRGLRKKFEGDPQMNHTATLLSYNEKTGKAELNNTWSAGSGDYVDRKAVTLENLWKALPRPESGPS